MILPCLFIALSKSMGKGVYTSENISDHSIVEISPVIVIGKEDRKLLDQTLLHNYIFEWGPDGNQCCLALGYISMYNHAYYSNCEYEMDYEEGVIRIRAKQFIASGDELFINYNGNWNDQKPVWFETK